jgi:DNA integrity scanning protein DisA with diadenylate cyclase activity
MTVDHLTFDAPVIASDGKTVITLADFLKRYLKQPQHETEALRLNATNILKVLGLPNVGQAEAKQATKWLRANGYRAVHQGKVFRVAMMYPQTARYHVVF